MSETFTKRMIWSVILVLAATTIYILLKPDSPAERADAAYDACWDAVDSKTATAWRKLQQVSARQVETDGDGFTVLGSFSTKTSGLTSFRCTVNADTTVTDMYVAPVKETS